jgi:hypothetical protein
MRRLLVIPFSVCAASTVFGSRAARAEEPRAPVALDVDLCAGVDAAEVRRLVPIELGAPLVESRGDEGAATRASVGCVANQPGLVRLAVRQPGPDPGTTKSLERLVALAQVPQADQARFVAISVVELLASAWGEPRHEPPRPPPEPPVYPVVVVAPAPAPAPEPPRWRVSVVGSARRFAGFSSVAPGGGLAVERSTKGGLAVAADVLAEATTQTTGLGSIDGLLASASLVGLARVGSGRFRVEPGLGARAGLVRLTGRGAAAASPPVRAGSVRGTWGGPLVALRAAVTLPHLLVLAVGGELGYATAGALGRIEGGPDVGVRGAWWGVLAGVGYGY